MLMSDKNTHNWEEAVANAPDLASDHSTPIPRSYRFSGQLYRFGPDLVALRMLDASQLYLLIRKEDVAGYKSIGEDSDDSEIELRVRGDARCFVAEEQTIEQLVDLLAARRMSIQAGAAPACQGAAPFILATPHHAAAAWYPSTLGGNIPLAQRGEFLTRGGTSLLKDERITLPEGGVGPQSEDDPDPVPPPQATAPARDSFTFSDVLAPPPNTPLGPFVPPQFKPLFDQPQQPFGPFLPGQGPGSKLPAADLNPGQFPFGPFAPPQQGTSPFTDTNPTIDGILSKITGGFDPPRADFTFDF